MGGEIENKKMKDGYIKLTLFKVDEYDCKSDEQSGMISEVFPPKETYFLQTRLDEVLSTQFNYNNDMCQFACEKYILFIYFYCKGKVGRNCL